MPAAMYKGRACYLALGRKQDAWKMGGDLLARFPASDEAALLKEETGKPKRRPRWRPGE